MARPHRTPLEMYPVIEDYVESGLTQRVFCGEHGLSLPVFTYWLNKYRREQGNQPAAAASPAFIELSGPVGGSGAALAEVVYPNGVRLRLFAWVEVESLAALIAAGA